MHGFRSILGLVALASGALSLTSCADEPAQELTGDTRDPLLARALNDPLMVDPDLAYRNEAAAVLTIGADHALPLLAGNAQQARRSRDEARLELLEDGQITELPAPSENEEGKLLAGLRSAAEMALAHGAPEECAKALRADFSWAARLDEVSSIMPLGHVRAAAGVESETCSLRVVSYFSAAEGEDVLQYHFNMARRSGLEVQTYQTPELSLRANSDKSDFAVNIRDARNAMRVVDLIYWSAP